MTEADKNAAHKKKMAKQKEKVDANIAEDLVRDFSRYSSRRR